MCIALNIANSHDSASNPRFSGCGRCRCCGMCSRARRLAEQELALSNRTELSISARPVHAVAAGTLAPESRAHARDAAHFNSAA